jgi:hypothetical protein
LIKEVEICFTERVVKYLSERRLPVLEVHPDKFLFSCNAAARFLLSDVVVEENESAVDQWLDWESACLFVSMLECIQKLIISQQ